VLVGLLLTDGTLMHANQAWLDAIGARLEDFAGMPFDQTWTRCRAAHGIAYARSGMKYAPSTR
jgi:hypothetical protein